MVRWRYLIVVGLIIAGLALAGAVRWAATDSCRNPAFLMRPSLGSGHPVPQFGDVIRATGGLPRSDAGWDGTNFTFPHYASLEEVSGWRIVAIEASTTESILAQVLDDDPTYDLSIEIDVEYANGLRGTLRWTRWQYGLLACPLVIPYGDGPEWVIESTDRPNQP